MRARYYYRPGHPKANERGFVIESDLGSWRQAEAINAPIMMDRFYENTAAPDGTDIGSRRRHKEYMRAHGLTTADDYTGTWQQAALERERITAGDVDHRERRDAIGRAAYELSKKRR